MRACDLYREIQDLNGLNVKGSKRRRNTLRYLNRLKNQKKRRQREQAAKAPFIARMYGDGQRQTLGARSREIQHLDATGAAADDMDAAS